MILTVQASSLPVSATTNIFPFPRHWSERNLDSKSKERRVVTLFPLRRLLVDSIVLSRLMLRIPTSVLSAVVNRHARTYGS